jgi:hypothetical protein
MATSDGRQGTATNKSTVTTSKSVFGGPGLPGLSQKLQEMLGGGGKRILILCSWLTRQLHGVAGGCG